MFYLVSQSREREVNQPELPPLTSSAKIALTEVSTRKVGQEWLLICPPTGAWCFVTREEMKVCDRLTHVAFDELQSQIAWPTDSLRSLLRHLYVRGIIAVYENARVHRVEWTTTPLAAPRTFMLAFQLSSRCNLACRYCYLGSPSGRDNDHHLSREVALRVLDYAFDQPVQSLSIDFGEIATARALFRDLVHDTRQLQDTYSKQASLAIQTNGTTLNPYFISFLKENSISVGISLDGPAHLNDRVRVFPNGVGSHKETVRALREVLRRAVPHIVTCTISRANCSHASVVLDHFLDLGVAHYFFKPIIQRGTAKTVWAQIGIAAEDYCRFLDEVVDYVETSGNLHALDESLLRHFFRALGHDRGWGSRCSSGYCNCGQDILFVSAEGKLYPCPRFACSDRELFCLGKETIETPGRRLLNELSARFCSLATACQSCPWRSLCHGGCALSAWYYSGDPGAVDPGCAILQHTYALVFERLIPMLRKRTGCALTTLGRVDVVDETLV